MEVFQPSTVGKWNRVYHGVSINGICEPGAEYDFFIGLNRQFQDLTKDFDYRIALVSAGIPGKILTSHAKSKGHIGIDFGCGTDMCLESDAAGLNTWEMKTGPKRTYVCQ